MRKPKKALSSRAKSLKAAINRARRRAKIEAGWVPTPPERRREKRESGRS
jgi:hypothetical protein